MKIHVYREITFFFPSCILNVQIYQKTKSLIYKYFAMHLFLYIFYRIPTEYINIAVGERGRKYLPCIERRVGLTMINWGGALSNSSKSSLFIKKRKKDEDGKKMVRHHGMQNEGERHGDGKLILN